MMLRRLLVAGVSLVLFSVGGVAVAGDPAVTATDRSDFKSASFPADSKFTQVKGSKFSPSAVYALGYLENRRLVSAELGYPGDFNGMLRARAGGIGPWEQFNLYTDDSGVYALQSAANGLFVV